MSSTRFSITDGFNGAKGSMNIYLRYKLLPKAKDPITITNQATSLVFRQVDQKLWIGIR